MEKRKRGHQKGVPSYTKGKKMGDNLTPEGRKKLSDLRKTPVKRVCVSCESEYMAGNSSKYCKKSCRPKRVYKYYYRPYKNFSKTRKESNLRNSKKWCINLKRKVFIYYGGDPPQCNCCGERYYEFLCLDHTNGGGNKHRKEFGLMSGTSTYRWLKRNNYPEGFRILCHNCNMSYSIYGYCPHKT